MSTKGTRVRKRNRFVSPTSGRRYVLLTSSIIHLLIASPVTIIYHSCASLVQSEGKRDCVKCSLITSDVILTDVSSSIKTRLNALK